MSRMPKSKSPVLDYAKRNPFTLIAPLEISKNEEGLFELDVFTEESLALDYDLKISLRVYGESVFIDDDAKATKRVARWICRDRAEEAYKSADRWSDGLYDVKKDAFLAPELKMSELVRLGFVSFRLQSSDLVDKTFAEIEPEILAAIEEVAERAEECAEFDDEFEFEIP